jgi:hypothetical protein
MTLRCAVRAYLVAANVITEVQAHDDRDVCEVLEVSVDRGAVESERHQGGNECLAGDGCCDLSQAIHNCDPRRGASQACRADCKPNCRELDLSRWGHFSFTAPRESPSESAASLGRHTAMSTG